MRRYKQQYQKPQLTDQGSVVATTRATQCGECWDGSPNQNDDTRSCGGGGTIELIEVGGQC